MLRSGADSTWGSQQQPWACLVKSNSHTVVEDADMIDQKPVPAVEARLSVLERQVAWWRRATVAALLVLALGGTLAFGPLIEE